VPRLPFGLPTLWAGVLKSKSRSRLPAAQAGQCTDSLKRSVRYSHSHEVLRENVGFQFLSLRQHLREPVSPRFCSAAKFACE
jgi:hypothetical protein